MSATRLRRQRKRNATINLFIWRSRTANARLRVEVCVFVLSLLRTSSLPPISLSCLIRRPTVASIDDENAPLLTGDEAWSISVRCVVSFFLSFFLQKTVILQFIMFVCAMVFDFAARHCRGRLSAARTQHRTSRLGSFFCYFQKLS